MTQAHTAPAVEPLDLRGRRGARAVRLGASERAACAALCLLLFAGHLLFGAARREVALAFAASGGLLLAAVVLACPWARRDLSRVGALAWPAAAFAAVVLLALWSLTPFAPGGPHPIWSFVTATAASATDKVAVILELVRLLGLGCVFLTAWLIGQDDDRARWFLRLLVAGAGLFALWAFVAHVVDPDILYGRIALPYTNQRLSAAFLSANTAGTCFGMSLVICAAAAAEGLRRAWRAHGLAGRPLLQAAPALAASGLCAVCLMLTASRGAVLATGLALTVFLGWEGAARRWRLPGAAGLVLAGAGAALGALLFIGGGPLLDRLAGAGQAAGDRAEIFQAHWRAALAAPWMGYGLGSFDAVNRMITTLQTYPRLWNIHAAHNVYLQWAEEAGLPGAAAMFAAVGLALALVVRGARRRIRMTTWLRGLAAVAVVPAIHGLTDFGLQIPSVAALFACTLGLGAGLAARPGSNGAPEPATAPRAALAAAALGLMVAAAGAVYAAETATAASARPLDWLALPAALDAEADRALPRDPVRARALTLRVLALRPVDGPSWLRLARLEARASGRLGPAGVGDLQRAYDVAPYAPELISTRLALVYDHWAELPADLRREAASEIDAAWPYPDQRGQLFAAVRQTQTGAGRLSLALELFRRRVAEAAGAGRPAAERPD